MKNIRLLLAFAFACLFLPHAAIAQTIHPGSAPIDQALRIIVPSKFKVAIDETISRDLNMSWPESPNWMVALVQATRKAGLQIHITWDKNLLRVVHPAPGNESSPALVAKPSGSTAVASAVAPAPAAAGAAPASLLLAEKVPSAQPLPTSQPVQLVEAIAELQPVTVSARASEQPLLAGSAVVPVTADPTPAASPVPAYKALVTDRNLRGVVNRWAREKGMQEVVWELASADIPVDREVPFVGDFEQALRGLMRTTSYTGQPARACLHSNEVVRIIPRTRFCNQP